METEKESMQRAIEIGKRKPSYRNSSLDEAMRTAILKLLLREK
jgi:hypothetical protein